MLLSKTDLSQAALLTAIAQVRGVVR
jgi:hypothetical protein